MNNSGVRVRGGEAGAAAHVRRVRVGAGGEPFFMFSLSTREEIYEKLQFCLCTVMKSVQWDEIS